MLTSPQAEEMEMFEWETPADDYDDTPEQVSSIRDIRLNMKVVAQQYATSAVRSLKKHAREVGSSMPHSRMSTNVPKYKPS